MSEVIISAKGNRIFHDQYCPYTRKIKKENQIRLPEWKARDTGYCGCKFCRSIKGLVYKFHKTGRKDISYDRIDNALCIRTDVGFWKIFWRENTQDWHLFHMNHGGRGHFDSTYPDKKLMRGAFHKQRDFLPSTHLQKVFQYIEEHDKSYRLAEEDVKKMPRNTPKQRNHYKYHKKRKRKESIQKVYKILDELNKKEK